MGGKDFRLGSAKAVIVGMMHKTADDTSKTPEGVAGLRSGVIGQGPVRANFGERTQDPLRGRAYWSAELEVVWDREIRARIA